MARCFWRAVSRWVLPQEQLLIPPSLWPWPLISGLKILPWGSHKPQRKAGAEALRLWSSLGKLGQVLFMPFLPLLAVNRERARRVFAGARQGVIGNVALRWREDLSCTLLAPVTKRFLWNAVESRFNHFFFFLMHPGVQLDSLLNLLSSFCRSTGIIGRSHPQKHSPFLCGNTRISGDTCSPALFCYFSVKSIFHMRTACIGGCTNWGGIWERNSF